MGLDPSYLDDSPRRGQHIHYHWHHHHHHVYVVPDSHYYQHHHTSTLTTSTPLHSPTQPLFSPNPHAAPIRISSDFYRGSPLHGLGRQRSSGRDRRRDPSHSPRSPRSPHPTAYHPGPFAEYPSPYTTKPGEFSARVPRRPAATAQPTPPTNEAQRQQDEVWRRYYQQFQPQYQQYHAAVQDQAGDDFERSYRGAFEAQHARLLQRDGFAGTGLDPRLFGGRAG